MPLQSVTSVSSVLPMGGPVTIWRLDFKQCRLSHIMRVEQRIPINAFRRSLLCWHAVVPIGLSALGKPLDPRTFLQVLPGCARDTTERLTAHTVRTFFKVHGSSMSSFCGFCRRYALLPHACMGLLVAVQVKDGEVSPGV